MPVPWRCPRRSKSASRARSAPGYGSTTPPSATAPEALPRTACKRAGGRGIASKSGRLSAPDRDVYCRPPSRRRTLARAVMLPATAPQTELRSAQLARVRSLLAAVLPTNAFYARKLASALRANSAHPMTSHNCRSPRKPNSPRIRPQPAVRHGPDLPARPLLPVPPDLRHQQRATAALARHRGVVGVDARLLARVLHADGAETGRATVLPVLVRPVSRVLDRVRRRGAGRVPLHPRRRDDQRRPAAVPRRTPLHRCCSRPPLTRFTWRKSRRKKGSTPRTAPCARSSSRASRAGTSRPHASASRPRGALRVLRSLRHDRSRAGRGGSRRTARGRCTY